MALVELSEHEKQQYLLITPKYCPPRTGSNFQLIHPIQYFPDILASIRTAPLVAVDFETRGGDYSEDIQAIGIGFSWDEGSCYFDMQDLSAGEHREIAHLLQEHPGLIAHNVYFDGGVAKKYLGVSPKWKYCTYSLYSMLANEGYAGRGWGLKTAQVELLQWPNSNETELDEWLVVNGYYIGNRRVETAADYLIREYQQGKIRPDKGEMWRAPVPVLGKYCILDAESTYLLFTELMEPLLQKFPELDAFVQDHWMGLIDTLVDQRIHGILMDRPGLVERKNTLIAEITQLDREFDANPEIRPHILEIEREMLETKGPTRPEQFKKDGGISKNFLKWEARMALIQNRQDPEFRFNMQSAPQLRKLLYDRLGYERKIFSEKGEPSVSGKALQSMGGIGTILTQRGYLVKELGYIEKYLELTENRPTIHPSFRTPGTTTGRLSSKEPNLQQVPKSKAVMSLFVARPGKVWVDLDFCLHPDTEYLTLRGWVKIKNLLDTDFVWSVNPDTLVGQWEIPSRIIRRHYEGPMYLVGNRRGKLAVTENHRMFWTNQSTRGRPYKHTTNYAQQGIPNNYLSTVQTSSMTFTGGYVPTDHELAMICLLQADSYKTRTKGYTIQVSLPRKRSRVRELLGPDKRSQVYPPHNTQILEVETWANVRYESSLLEDKSLDLSNLCSSVADKLVQELLFWDGSLGRSGEVIYGSTDIKTIESIQTYLVRCGYECKLKGRQPKYPGSKYFYTLTIRKSKGIRLRKGIDDVHTYNYTGEVGCVTVSTGYIQVRYHGQTFITGNCALEPVVTTEYSEDPNLKLIYDTGRPDNDIYLFVLAKSNTPLGAKILATGYNPDNPTKESIARAKKECKHERSIGKTLWLSYQYGAGTNKMHRTLEEQEVFLDWSLVDAIRKGFDTTFAKLKDFARALHYERRRNKGYILNGMGRPMAVPDEFEKDILNRFIQSTGHDVLTTYITLLKRNLDSAGIKWDPIIIDFHDATTVEVDEKDGSRTVEIFNRSMQDLNELLRGTIQLKGVPVIGRNLAEVKEPEE